MLLVPPVNISLQTWHDWGCAGYFLVILCSALCTSLPPDWACNEAAFSHYNEEMNNSQSVTVSLVVISCVRSGHKSTRGLWVISNSPNLLAVLVHSEIQIQLSIMQSLLTWAVQCKGCIVGEVKTSEECSKKLDIVIREQSRMTGDRYSAGVFQRIDVQSFGLFKPPLKSWGISN